MTNVVNTFGEMTYNGITRYRGEIFTLAEAMNDEKLIRIHYVRVIDGERIEAINKTRVRDDYSGRDFIDELSLQAYRRNAPNDAVVLRRKVGRPRKVASA